MNSIKRSVQALAGIYMICIGTVLFFLPMLIEAADRIVIKEGRCCRTITERVDYWLVEGECERHVTGMVQYEESKTYADFKLVGVAVDTLAVAADTSGCQ